MDTFPFCTLPVVLPSQAEDAVNAFTRKQLREDGILNKLFEAKPLDNDDIRTTVGDVRQQLADNMLRDMVLEEDRKFLAALDNAMPDETRTGGITRDTLAAAARLIPLMKPEPVFFSRQMLADLKEWSGERIRGIRANRIMVDDQQDIPIQLDLWEDLKR